MGRKRNPETMQAIYYQIEQYPGMKPAFLARVLGLNRSQVTRSLPAMEERDYLISEDEKGGLWPFRKNGK